MVNIGANIVKQFLNRLTLGFDLTNSCCANSITSEIFSASEYSCAVTPQVRQTGNRLSGLAGTAYASLLT